MDKFVIVTKPSTSRRMANGCEGKARTSSTRFSYAPYDLSKKHDSKSEVQRGRKNIERILPHLIKDGAKLSKAEITKHLINNLSDESNPITHSDIYERSDHICSAATGHQRCERRSGVNKNYWDLRSEKLKQQLPDVPNAPEAKVLRNVRVYINGYLEDTTDIEMKRIVTLAGGQALNAASGATHILTSQQLSGTKTHKLLTTRTKTMVHVVRPEWVTDSIRAGIRLPESRYSVIRGANTIEDMFKLSSQKDSA